MIVAHDGYLKQVDAVLKPLPGRLKPLQAQFAEPENQQQQQEAAEGLSQQYGTTAGAVKAISPPQADKARHAALLKPLGDARDQWAAVAKSIEANTQVGFDIAVKRRRRSRGGAQAGDRRGLREHTVSVARAVVRLRARTGAQQPPHDLEAEIAPDVTVGAFADAVADRLELNGTSKLATVLERTGAILRSDEPLLGAGRAQRRHACSEAGGRGRAARAHGRPVALRPGRRRRSVRGSGRHATSGHLRDRP